MPLPAWALVVSFWLHMLATVVWIGGLAALVILVLPSLRRILKPPEFARWLAALNKRLDPIGWFSLGLLAFTGLVQMEANPSYAGLLAVANPWSQAILLKHIAFIGMIAVSTYITWGVAPAMQHAAILDSRKGAGAGSRWQTRLQRLISLNFILGLLILAFTALARIS